MLAGEDLEAVALEFAQYEVDLIDPNMEEKEPNGED